MREVHAISGTIRRGPEPECEWYILANEAHMPIGLSHVETMTDRIRVHYDFVAERVGHVHVTNDESFAAFPAVSAGASVGLTYTDIFVYGSNAVSASNPTGRVNPKGLSRTNANFWLSGLMWGAELPDY